MINVTHAKGPFMMQTRNVAKLEIYNLISKGRAVGTGWCVALYTAQGTRRHTIRSFEGNEAAARAFCAEMNALEDL